MLSLDLYVACILTASAAASPLLNERGDPNLSSSPLSLRAGIRLRIIPNTSGSLLESDLSRAQKLTGGRKSNHLTSMPVSEPINGSGIIATLEVGVGTPPTMYELIVDTGSSNTFVGASTPYVSTNSSKDTGEKVSVEYGSGEFSGEEFTDDITLSSTVITSQSIGVASQSQGFNGFDGILGLGPDGLTKGTLVNNSQATIPTITENLVKEGEIATPLVGISLPLAGCPGNGNGVIEFGAVDPGNFVGEIRFVPITQKSPSNDFWGVDQTITYGDDHTKILSGGPGIVDTGTTLLLLASDVVQTYTNITGATLDKNTGLLKVENPDSLKSLFFQMGNVTLEFPGNAQIWPRSLNKEIGGDNNSTYLIVQDIGSPSGQGMDFIMGFTVLQRFYSVFEATGPRRVGFASTTQTNATCN